MSEDGLRKVHRNCLCLQGLLTRFRRNRTTTATTVVDGEVDNQGLIDTNGHNVNGND